MSSANAPYGFSAASTPATQQASSDNTDQRLEIAKRFIAGKIQNARGTLMWAACESNDPVDWKTLRDATSLLELSLRYARDAPFGRIAGRLMPVGLLAAVTQAD